MATYLPYLLSLGLIASKDTSADMLVLQEKTGPFRTWYQWTFVDFAFDSPVERQVAIETGEFVQENNLPLGIEVYKDRLFVTLPKWKPGVPATLAVLPRTPREASPLLVPYPNWRWHTTGGCNFEAEFNAEGSWELYQDLGTKFALGSTFCAKVF